MRWTLSSDRCQQPQTYRQHPSHVSTHLVGVDPGIGSRKRDVDDRQRDARREQEAQHGEAPVLDLEVPPREPLVLPPAAAAIIVPAALVLVVVVAVPVAAAVAMMVVMVLGRG